jgi:hypothetical protein
MLLAHSVREINRSNKPVGIVKQMELLAVADAELQA